MFYLSSRSIVQISGNDGLLQRLFTANLNKIKDFTFSAMLNAKGRFLFDFFIYKKENSFLIDINTQCVASFIKMLKHYDILNELSIEIKSNLKVLASLQFLINWSDGKFEGRIITENIPENCKTEEEYNEQRIQLCLPDGFLELTFEKSIILEFGYEEAGGMSFNKGCYTGQELMTRTKRMGEVRKALYCIFHENLPQILTDKTLPNLLSSFGNFALILGYKQDFQDKKYFQFEGENFLIMRSSSI